MSKLEFTLLVVIVFSAIEGRLAVDYSVTNTAESTSGGAKFNNDIGAAYAQDTMAAATAFIWNTLEQNNADDRKAIDRVALFIDDMDGVAYANSNSEIHVSARYIGGYNGDVKREFTGVIYHEMTHIWQWNGSGRAPGGLIEGIADYVRLKAGYAPSHWVSAGQGDRWDQGYDVTARFLDYCDSLSGGFVAELNRRMRSDYSEDYFQQILGKPVATLWADYKARFANN